MSSKCPLCSSERIIPYFEYNKGKKKYNYYQCTHCSVVFMGRNHLLKADEEKKRYVKHINSKRTVGYESFLRELIDPVLKRVENGARGLDYGSGPYPMLAEICREEGYHMQIYDAFFANNQDVLNKKYDFITCCEVIEHFYYPDQEFSRLCECLTDGAYLGIKTGILYPEIIFSNWYYKEDETHVIFFTPRAFKWIAEKYNLEIEYFQKNVIIFKKTFSL